MSANTQKGLLAYICVTPKPSNLTREQFEALVWVPIAKVGSVGESGVNTNIVQYDMLAEEMTQKQKGNSDGQNTPIECARDLSDAGQQALRTAGAPLNRYNYAMKFEDNDKPSDDYTNTITYRRGVITGPTRAGGRSEDFITDAFMLGNNQKEIIVAPEADDPPTNTVKPSIVGTVVQVGVELTALEGEWLGKPTSYTYQWQHDASGNGTFSNVSVGGTAKKYTPVVGDVADSIRVQVTAINGAGSSSAANSLGTIPIIAA